MRGIGFCPVIKGTIQSKPLIWQMDNRIVGDNIEFPKTFIIPTLKNDRLLGKPTRFIGKFWLIVLNSPPIFFF